MPLVRHNVSGVCPNCKREFVEFCIYIAPCFDRDGPIIIFVYDHTDTVCGSLELPSGSTVTVESDRDFAPPKDKAAPKN